VGYIVSYLAIVAGLFGFSGLDLAEIAIAMVVVFVLLILAAKGGKNSSSNSTYFFDE
jgi:uncharacterized membrane protein YtjA (UPF0391 family)